MKFKSHRLIAASAASALAFGGIVGSGIVFAQSGADANSSASGSVAMQAPSAEDRAAKFEEYLTALASNLGISLDALKTGITTTNLQFLDKAVADGKITAEQAAEIRTKIESGDAHFFGIGGGMRGGGHPGGHGGPGMMIGGQADVAGFLGITEDALRTALSSGQTLAQVAEANGKTRQQLVDFLVTSANTAIDKAVADGKITAEQAAEMKAKAAEHAEEHVDSTGRGPRGGGPRMGGQVN